MKSDTLAIAFLSLLCAVSSEAQELFRAPDPGTHTRWVSPENPRGEKGKGGLTNRGAKGNAFYVISPGEQKVIFDVKGPGIIERMWLSGTLGTTPQQRRAVRLDMYWDGAKTPAVSAPLGDFFGIAHGLIARYDNALFQSPEARSFSFTIPMPYRTSAHITVSNESSTELQLWYDIDYLEVERLPEDALYFHTFWSRNPSTTPGEDFVILPQVEGVGRYLGTNIGVICDSAYKETWFGEGEVKVYLDGDRDTPTLTGTGTEDYIGSGYGQGEFVGRHTGSPVSSPQNGVYAFYRYHIPDPVYFHVDCKVTIQQMGNALVTDVLKMKEKGTLLVPVWYYGSDSGKTYQGRLLGEHGHRKIEDRGFPKTGVNFYRSDDVSATAYFYLNKPENGLPPLAPVALRLKDLDERVWKRLK